MRTCDGCGSRMPPYLPRKTINGKKLCEGCQMWHSKTAALHNPTGELRGEHPQEWYHGSTHDFENFGHHGGFHWNTHLGHHFTAQHEIAERFASGETSDDDGYSDDEDNAPEGHIVHAKLHIKNPKTYRSEHDMDQEAYEHERARGNHIDNYVKKAPDPFDPHGEYADEDDEWDDPEDDHYNAKKYEGDSQEHYTPNDRDHGYYSDHRQFHPVATGWLNSHPDKEGIAARFKQRLVDQGHDGIVYGNDFEQNRYDKGSKDLPYHSHPPLDTPEVGEHNRIVPQHSISAITFHPHQIEVTQHHYGDEHKTPDEIADPRHKYVDDRLPPAQGPHRQPRFPDTDVTRRPGTPKYKPVTHIPAEHEPLTSYSSSDMIDLYHHTTPAKAEKIMRGGFKSGRGSTYFTDNPSSAALTQGWGSAQIHVRMPSNKAHFLMPVDDHEAYYVANNHEILPEHIMGINHLGKTANLGDPTDWDVHHPTLPGEVHRGMPVKFSQKVRDQLANGSKEQAAQAILDKTQGKATGPHWSADLEQSRTFAHRVSSDWKGEVPVVLHASTPVREDIETRPTALKRMQIFPYDDRVQDEREVPVRKGRHVDVTGVSWRVPEHPEADDRGWVRHDFPTGRQHTAATAPEYAANHAGKQTVWTVATPQGTTQLCQYHRNVHQSLNAASNGLAGSLGIPQSASELLEGSQRGRCAACSKDPGYALKLARPEGFDNQQVKDSKQPRHQRQPYMPDKTRPLTPLRQSLNSGQSWYHADKGGVRHKEDGYEGDHHVPAGSALHSDVNEAWKAAIGHWDSGHSDFPRVYQVHKADVEAHGDGHGTLRAHAEGSEVEHNHEKHPALRSKYDDDGAPVMFHGTTKYFDEDDDPEEITPSGGSQSFGPGVADPSYAYATPKLSDAWSYAEKRSENVGGKPHVYRVTPHDPEDVEEDPKHTGDYSRGNYQNDKRSKSGFGVLDEVPMSHKQQHEWKNSPHNEEDDWDSDDEDDHHYGMKTANTQMELFHAEPMGKQPSPKDEWQHKMVKKHGPKPEVEDDEHEIDECDYCGHDKNDDGHAEAHDAWQSEQKWHTNWDEDRQVGAHNNNEIQRGMAMSLPQHIHDIVHDQSRPVEERGRVLANHVLQSANDEGHIGRFWTDEDSVSRDYAENSRVALHSKDDHGTDKTPVTVHVKFPGYKHIETDPDELEHHGVYSYHIENNREVPLQHGTPLEVAGVSWAPPRDNYRSHNSEPHEWQRHDFKEPIKAMSSKKRLPSLRQIVAHDATENQAIRHCAFCGSGKIIGRADGSVECEFCHNYFTVQVQPQYPNFPQTIDGQPQNIPGMPGQVETPSVEGGGGGFPPGEEDPAAEGGNPFAEGGDEEDDTEGFPNQAGGQDEEPQDTQPPPFAKKSFRTVTGARLQESDYVNHLALSLLKGDERDAMLAVIRGDLGA